MSTPQDNETEDLEFEEAMEKVLKDLAGVNEILADY